MHGTTIILNLQGPFWYPKVQGKYDEQTDPSGMWESLQCGPTEAKPPPRGQHKLKTLPESRSCVQQDRDGTGIPRLESPFWETAPQRMKTGLKRDNINTCSNKQPNKAETCPDSKRPAIIFKKPDNETSGITQEQGVGGSQCAKRITTRLPPLPRARRYVWTPRIGVYYRKDAQASNAIKRIRSLISLPSRHRKMAIEHPPGSKEYQKEKKRIEKNKARNQRRKMRRAQGPLYPFALHVKAGPNRNELISLTEWRTILTQAVGLAYDEISQRCEAGELQNDLMLQSAYFIEHVPADMKVKGKKSTDNPPDKRIGHGLCLFLKPQAKELFNNCFGQVIFQRDGKSVKTYTRRKIQDVRAHYLLRIDKPLWTPLQIGDNFETSIRRGNSTFPQEPGIRLKQVKINNFGQAVIMFTASRAWEHALHSARNKVNTPFGTFELKKLNSGRDQDVVDEAEGDDGFDDDEFEDANEDDDSQNGADDDPMDEEPQPSGSGGAGALPPTPKDTKKQAATDGTGATPPAKRQENNRFRASTLQAGAKYCANRNGHK